MNPMTFFKPAKSWKEQYKRFCYWLDPFKSPYGIHILSFRLYVWAHQDEALSVAQFLQNYAIPRRVFKKWLNDYYELREAHDFALMCIGSRREQLALYNKINIQVFSETQGYYDDVWRSSETFHANLKQGYTETKTEYKSVTVELPTFEAEQQPEIKLNPVVLDEYIEYQITVNACQPAQKQIKAHIPVQPITVEQVGSVQC